MQPGTGAKAESSLVSGYYARYDTHTLADTSLLEETLPRCFGGETTHPGIRPLSYGETPLELVDELLDWAGLKAGDSFLDLGCGCGGVVLTAAGRARRAAGIDLIPAAVKFARGAAEQLKIANVDFLEGDLLEMSLGHFEVIYCCATAVSDWLCRELSGKLDECRPGTRFLTVTHALEHDRVRSLDQRTLRFSWGHLQRRSDWHFYLHRLS